MSLAESIEKRAAQFAERYKAVYKQLGRVIVGHNDIVHGVLTCLFVGGHCLLEGVPGLGKTLLVRTLAQTLDLDFSRIQFTPDLMPADILGTNMIIEDRNGPPRVSVPEGADLHADLPGGRNQPGHAEDAVGPARSHAGAEHQHRRRSVPAQAAVLRDGHAEPDRAGRHVPAARSAARPLLLQAGGRLLQPRRAEHDHRPHHEGRERPARQGDGRRRRSCSGSSWCAK